MITISGNAIDANTLSNQLKLNQLEKRAADALYSSPSVYNYSSTEQLKFELSCRQKTVEAALKLNQSYFSFKIFRESRCNPNYWKRTDKGGFLLKPEAKPSDAINDIYINSRRYATECATAIVIVFYKALLDVLPESLFNQLFSEIYLMNWQHMNPSLGVSTYRDIVDFVPGDCRYFKNPDVNPLTPEWQGENAIDLSNGLYYGHGIGVRTSAEIIKLLNKKRESGSNVSAYLTGTATRPNYKHLADKYYSFSPRIQASKTIGCFRSPAGAK